MEKDDKSIEVMDYPKIEKWRKIAHKRFNAFLRSNNIHDFIDWKKHVWLIEGYNEGIKWRNENESKN